jgi:dihydroanticapsin dehydrogenase
VTGENTAAVVLVVGGGWDGLEDGPLSVGCAICLRLARDAYQVVVFDLEDENAERTIARMRDEGLDAYKIVGDTAVQEDCMRAVDEVVERYGRVDHVINNVGIGVLRQHEPGTQAYVDRIVAVNFTGPMLMVSAATPHLPERGSIVNVSSVYGGVDPRPDAYGITKRAESLVLTPSMAVELAPKGIRVNCVTAGYIWNAVTAGTQSTQGSPDESLEEYRRGRAQTLNAFKREGGPVDVANAVAFFVSDEAWWITGQDLIVDGGYSLLNYWDTTSYAERAAESRARGKQREKGVSR